MRSSEVKRWFLAGPAMTLGLLLSGCGGGGDGVASTPPPTYTKLADLTGNRTFQSAGAHLTIANGQFTDHSIQKYGAGVTIAYNASSDSYTLTAPDGATDTFSGSSSPPPGYTPAPNQIALSNSTGAGGTFVLTVPSVNGIALSYTAQGSWNHFGNNVLSAYFGVSGVPTIAGDMPRNGTATYQTSVAGLAVRTDGAYNLDTTSSGTFSADFGAGTVATTLHLAGVPSSATPFLPGPGAQPSADFGSYTGTGTIASGSPGFSGTLASTGSSSVVANGEFAGAFFGPQAKEMGYGFYVASTGFSAQGTVVGTK
jgi:hypothetical protein